MKVDQKKLIDRLKRNFETYPLPRNEIESIWKEVLQLDSINPDDNFFEIGGDSLSSLMLISQINKTFQINLKVGYVIENPVFKIFNANLFKKDHSKSEIVTLKEGKMDCPIFLIPLLDSGSEVYYYLSKNLNTKQSVFSFNNQLEYDHNYNDYNFSKINASLIESLSKKYAGLIIKSEISKKIILAGYSLGGNIAIETSFELKKHNIEVEQIHLMDSHKFGNTVHSTWSEFRLNRLYIRKFFTYLAAGIYYRKKNKFNQLLQFLWERDEINPHQIKNIPVFLYKCLDISPMKKFKFIDPASLDWKLKIDQLEIVNINTDHASMLKKGSVKELADKMDESINSLLHELGLQIKELDHLTKAEFDHFLSKAWFRLSFGNHMFTDTRASFENKYFPIKWIRYKLDASFMSKSIKKDKNYKQCKIFTPILADLNYENDKEELESLYAKYRSNINFDGYKSLHNVMYHGEADRSIFNSKIIKLYDKDKLIGVGIFDLGEISGAGTLYYYDHDYARYGISKFLSLLFLEYLVENQHRYFYPGFIYIGHPKMNYKLSVEKSGIEYYDQLTDQWLLYDS